MNLRPFEFKEIRPGNCLFYSAIDPNKNFTKIHITERAQESLKITLQ